MNPTLMAAFLRQRFTSPMRLGLLFLVTVFPLGASMLMGSLSPLAEVGAGISLILAAGAIGQDVSSGTLQLLLVRPVSRPSVLVNRWLATILATVTIVMAMLALGTLAILARGAHPDALDLVRLVLDNACSAAGHAAVMIMLSTLAGGLGDVGLYVGSFITIQAFNGLGMLKNWPALVRACEEAQHVLAPQLAWSWLASHSAPSWFAIASFASTVTLALAIGIARLNRRELSYASG